VCAGGMVYGAAATPGPRRDRAERHVPAAGKQAANGRHAVDGRDDGFYIVYFKQPGVADAELAADMPQAFTRLLHGASGEVASSAGPAAPVFAADGEFLQLWPTTARSSGLSRRRRAVGG
jgi:hypothetical protein